MVNCQKISSSPAKIGLVALVSLLFAVTTVKAEGTSTPSPSPQVFQEQHQEQKQENNQTVNLTVNQSQTETASGGTRAVRTSSKGGVEATGSAKQPTTGPSVLGMTLMFGAIPLGFMLSGFGRGRILMLAQKEENIASLAKKLVKVRRTRNHLT